MSGARDLILRASDAVNAVALTLAKLALAGMVCVIGVQVVARYVLNAPPGWTEELARYLMVWAGLLGATAAFRRAVDPSVFPTKENGHGLAAMASRMAIAAAVLIFIVPILYDCFVGTGFDAGRGFLLRNYARTSPGLGVNMVFVAAAIPTFSIILLVHLAARLVAGPKRAQPEDMHAADLI